MQARNTAIQPHHAATDAPQWRYEQNRLGWDYFTAHESPARCQNAEQRKGYMDAMNSYAVAHMPASAAEHLGF